MKIREGGRHSRLHKFRNCSYSWGMGLDRGPIFEASEDVSSVKEKAASGASIAVGWTEEQDKFASRTPY